MPQKKEPQHCFEYWNCPSENREKCPAYTVVRDRNCWAYGTEARPKCKRNFNYCWECPWFQKLTNGGGK